MPDQAFLLGRRPHALVIYKVLRSRQPRFAVTYLLIGYSREMKDCAGGLASKSILNYRLSYFFYLRFLPVSWNEVDV